ncbi:MAG: phosphotransferase [Pseudomonadales bacterium]|nr:phosphotransferase [Pseudomonadales bacterium]MCP5329577.1 phosphotransferase [Pseudomonadales bacterium]
MDERKTALTAWARQCLEEMCDQAGVAGDVETVSGDASFRRYFRMRLNRPMDCMMGMVNEKLLPILHDTQFLLVDAPPEHEDCHRFVRIAHLFRQAGMNTPRVLEVDYERGFMLLQDFGDALYLPALQEGRDVDALYTAAMESLVLLQANGKGDELPPYDRALLHRELSLFDDWFCEAFLGLILTEAERDLLARTWAMLEDAALAQPQVCVHRDYHSRNLMIISNDPAEAPGVIDFQDAVLGAYTYDLVSLLRDCYIVWPAARVREWALQYRQMAIVAGVLPEGSPQAAEAFLRDFDLMGLQRHLKVIGIFSRLNLRDGKLRYMADIPVVIDYVLEVAAEHPEMAEFLQWFQNRVLPLACETLAPYSRESLAS